MQQEVKNAAENIIRRYTAAPDTMHQEIGRKESCGSRPF
jgi:hypothetical protein